MDARALSQAAPQPQKTMRGRRLDRHENVTHQLLIYGRGEQVFFYWS
jgi:hypothetical protein